MITEIIKKSLYFTVLIIFFFCTNSPELFVLSSIVCTVVQVTVNAIPNIKLIDYKVRYQVMDILPNLLIAVVMGFLVYCVGLLNFNNVLKLVIQIFSGALIYVLLAVVTRNKSFSYLKSIVKEFVKNHG